MTKKKIKWFLLALLSPFIYVLILGYKKPFKLDPVSVGANRIEEYLPLLLNKKVGFFGNHTSLVKVNDSQYIHTIDTLLSLGVNIVRIFSPEHGFRGKSAAGEENKEEGKYRTKIPIVSTYKEDSYKPHDSFFKDLDIVVFDIQDVGVRFYTYISSLEFMLSACFENFVDFMVLDRPNPNIGYVDGPVLKSEFKSFVGMQPIPVVYGMTIGEYASMILGEKWVNIDVKKMFHASKRKNKNISYINDDIINTPAFNIVPCSNYYRDNSTYLLPVPPSPNLKNINSIYLYPSLCFFEGTTISVGRGTKHAFECFGSPFFRDSLFTFYVKSKNDSTLHFGFDLRNFISPNQKPKQLKLQWLLTAYSLYPKNKNFFYYEDFFDKLAGSDNLRKQILLGYNKEYIRETWQKDIETFMTIRKKYLLYKNN